jgi:hypothetical protein
MTPESFSLRFADRRGAFMIVNNEAPPRDPNDDDDEDEEEDEEDEDKEPPVVREPDEDCGRFERTI